jgi:hypothetical protein
MDGTSFGIGAYLQSHLVRRVPSYTLNGSMLGADNLIERHQSLRRPGWPWKWQHAQA